jgi:hypothetical protein
MQKHQDTIVNRNFKIHHVCSRVWDSLSSCVRDTWILRDWVSTEKSPMKNPGRNWVLPMGNGKQLHQRFVLLQQVGLYLKVITFAGLLFKYVRTQRTEFPLALASTVNRLRSFDKTWTTQKITSPIIIVFHGKVFTEPSLSNDKGMHTKTRRLSFDTTRII